MSKEGSGRVELMRGFVALGNGNPGASDAAIADLEMRVGPLPDDYKDVLCAADGLEGFFGRSYVRLYSCVDVYRVRGYPDANGNEVEDVGVVLIGSNGGGEGYGIRCVDGRVEYVLIPFIGGVEDIDVLGLGMVEFVERLERGLFE